LARPAIRTVRCILRHEDRFLLVMHRHTHKGRRARWGLPGGHVEARERYEDTARRELREELGIALAELREVGDYRFRGALHRVFGAEHASPILRFRRAELLKIAWHSLNEVVALRDRGLLHAGYEAQAITDLLTRIDGGPARKPSR
jgi:8-oxo-dGTP pyrophosphatase MutT (NUDIX family)